VSIIKKQKKNSCIESDWLKQNHLGFSKSAKEDSSESFGLKLCFKIFSVGFEETGVP